MNQIIEFMNRNFFSNATSNYLVPALATIIAGAFTCIIAWNNWRKEEKKDYYDMLEKKFLIYSKLYLKLRDRGRNFYLLDEKELIELIDNNCYLVDENTYEIILTLLNLEKESKGPEVNIAKMPLERHKRLLCTLVSVVSKDYISLLGQKRRIEKKLRSKYSDTEYNDITYVWLSLYGNMFKWGFAVLALVLLIYIGNASIFKDVSKNIQGKSFGYSLAYVGFTVCFFAGSAVVIIIIIKLIIVLVKIVLSKLGIYIGRIAKKDGIYSSLTYRDRIFAYKYEMLPKYGVWKCNAPKTSDK